MKINSSEIKKYFEMRENLFKKLEKLLNKVGIEGCDLNTLDIKKNCKIIDRNNQKILVDEDGEEFGEQCDNYFVNQWTGYCCDDYHGYIYLPTDEKGTYIEMYYSC